MKIIAHRSCEAIAHKADAFLKGASADISGAIADMTLHIGPANHPDYQTPMHARDAIFVGDGSHMGSLIASTQLKALYAQNPKAVSLQPRWNSGTNKWDMVATENRIGDAAPDLIQAQGISPWNQGYFQGIFERPLLYSHAHDLVKIEQGNKPWCEVMNLMLDDFGGSAMGPSKAGSPENSMTKDITVTAGMMTSQVVNMYVTYSLTIEESEGAKSVASDNPYGGTLLAKKIKYANYVLELLTDYLIYFGNADTNTYGLMQVNPVTSITGGSLKSIVAGAGQTKGSMIYQKVAGIVNTFFSESFNKFDHIKIGMSTYAYNLFCSTPYSDTYSPKSARAVFDENYNGGRGEMDKEPRIEFFADPMLDANTEFNSQKYDYLTITAPEVGTGPEDTRQSIIKCGMPLKEFVYPVIPGMVNTQHRMLRRYAGVFAPVNKSVKIYSGFGVDGTED